MARGQQMGDRSVETCDGVGLREVVVTQMSAIDSCAFCCGMLLGEIWCCGAGTGLRFLEGLVSEVVCGASCFGLLLNQVDLKSYCIVFQMFACCFGGQLFFFVHCVRCEGCCFVLLCDGIWEMRVCLLVLRCGLSLLGGILDSLWSSRVIVVDVMCHVFGWEAVPRRTCKWIVVSGVCFERGVGPWPSLLFGAFPSTC